MSEVKALRKRLDNLKVPQKEPASKKPTETKTPRPNPKVEARNRELAEWASLRQKVASLDKQAGQLTKEKAEALEATKKAEEAKDKAEKELKERPKVYQLEHEYETNWGWVAVGLAAGVFVGIVVMRLLVSYL